MSSKKHLELSSRILIEDGLNKRLPVSAIASSVGKHSTTVARRSSSIVTSTVLGPCASTTIPALTAMTAPGRMSARYAIPTSTTSTAVTADCAMAPVLNSGRLVAGDSKDLHLSAMVATSVENAVLRKCFTRPNTLKGITKSFALRPDPGSHSLRMSLPSLTL